MSNSENKKLKADEVEEPKTYINLYCCHLSLNIIYTLSYVSAAIFLNIINRVVFYTYHFNKYNFTFMLLQQLFCIVFFLIVSHKSKTFKAKAGEISFKDFLSLKHYYISFGIVFILNALVTIIGTQMIINASMFQTLRRLTLVKVYIFDLFYGYKKITTFTSICVFLVTLGGLLSGIDYFSRDYLGIGITMIANIITVAYNKFTESFKRRTGVSNLKLLVYNCYLAGPVLFSLIFITGEYKKLILYFQEEGYLSGADKTEGSFLGFFFSVFFSCSLLIVLNCGFFMSNESNSSLFTILLANTKDIFVGILSYFILAGNKFTILIAIGMIISITGGVLFSTKSICDNMITGKVEPKVEKKHSDETILNVEEKKLKDIDNNSDNSENNDNNDNNITINIEENKLKETDNANENSEINLNTK